MPLEHRRHGRARRFAVTATVALSMMQGCTQSTKQAPRGRARGVDVEARSDLRPHFLPGPTGVGGDAGMLPGDTAGTGDAGGSPEGGNAGAPAGGMAGEGDAGDSAAPEFCGDGERGPLGEECDLGAEGDAQGCSVDCKVKASVVAFDGEAKTLEVGLGPHALATGEEGGGIVFVGQANEVRLVPFDAGGRQLEAVTVASENVSEGADPVVASLPDGDFAVAFTGYGADTAGLDVVLARVSANGKVSSAGFPGDSAVGPQRNTDILALEDRVVVVWTEGFSDILARELDFELAPLGPVIPVATSEDLEDAPALAPDGNGWSLAFRQSADTGERIGLFARGTLTFSEPQPFGVDAERPALASLGDGRFLVVHNVAIDPTVTTTAPELIGYVFEPASGTVEPWDLSDGDGDSQHLPCLASFGTRLLLSYQSETPDETTGVAASHAYLRELEFDGKKLLASTPHLLAASTARSSSARPSVAGSSWLAGVSWIEPGHGADANPDLYRMFYPLPLVDAPSYANTLPDRAR